MDLGDNPCRCQDCACRVVAVSCIDTHAARRNAVFTSGDVHFGRKLARYLLREDLDERADNTDVDRAYEFLGHPIVVVASPFLYRWLRLVLIGF